MSELSPRYGAALRLVCFAHAGGGPAAYVPWARALEQVPIAVAAVHLPGRESRGGEPLCRDLATMTTAIADAVSRTDAATAFFGHSMGAVLAFEVARELERRSAGRPAIVFVSGAPAPQLPRVDDRIRDVEGDLPFLEAVASKYGGIPRIVLERADLRADAAAVLRTDLAMTETYAFTPGAPLTRPLVAYGGEADPIVAGERLDAWRAMTTGAFACRRFPGDHFYLNRARDALLTDIVSHLRPWLT